MRETLKVLSPWLKSLSWLGLFLVMISVSFFFAMGIVSGIWGMSFDGLESFSLFLNDFEAPQNVGANKVTNLVNQIFGFGLSSVAVFYLFGKKSIDGFWFTTPRRSIWLVPLMGVFILPVIELTLRLNEWIIPEGGAIESIFKPLEDQAAELTESMLQMGGAGDLALNLFLIALIPAICEELAFRGVLQSLFAKGSKNVHVGIWMSAFFFSLIHFQFYGFIPRMLLGGFFGYLLIWTGSIWAPILAHFVNNALSVIVHFVVQHNPDMIEGQLEEQSVEMIPLIVMGVLLNLSIVVMLKNNAWPSIREKYLQSDRPGDSVIGHHRLN